MARVAKHTRVTSTGRRVPVKAHTRRQLSPQRAGKYATQAIRLGARGWKASSKRRKRQLYTAAFVAGTVAATQIGAWSLLRAGGLALSAVAVGALAGHALIRRYAR